VETFVNVHLPWIASLLVVIVGGGWRLSREFGKLSESLSAKLDLVQCAKIRHECVTNVMEEVKDVRDKSEEIRNKVDETREAFARTEGHLTKAVSVLEEAVREIKKANGYNKP
jgi:uncharacterized coiled-coil DUF342 family protein